MTKKGFTKEKIDFVFLVNKQDGACIDMICISAIDQIGSSCVPFFLHATACQSMGTLGCVLVCGHAVFSQSPCWGNLSCTVIKYSVPVNWDAVSPCRPTLCVTYELSSQNCSITYFPSFFFSKMVDCLHFQFGTFCPKSNKMTRDPVVTYISDEK